MCKDKNNNNIKKKTKSKYEMLIFNKEVKIIKGRRHITIWLSPHLENIPNIV